MASSDGGRRGIRRSRRKRRRPGGRGGSYRSQEEDARALGVTHQTVCNWLADDVAKICNDPGSTRLNVVPQLRNDPESPRLNVESEEAGSVGWPMTLQRFVMTLSRPGSTSFSKSKTTLSQLGSRTL